MLELPFRDRADAGRLLGAKLAVRDISKDSIVLGLPRGGVPVAFEVARALELPLDALLVRKLGAPRQPELALGAIAPGIEVVDRRPMAAVGRGGAQRRAITGRARGERERPPPRC